MSAELQAFVVALLLTTIPNIVIKMIEKYKSTSEVNKASLEAADLSLDMLKESLCSCREYTKILEERCGKLEAENKELHRENVLMHDKISRLGS